MPGDTSHLNQNKKMTDIYPHLRYFKRSEFSNPDGMSTELLLKLDWARHKSKLPFLLTSTYRANDVRSHGKGLAADISCKNSAHRLIIIKSLLSVGFERIGIYPEHLHVDVSVDSPAVLWYGKY